MATTSSTSENGTPTLTGSCLCQSVKYSLTGDTVAKLICHCTNCKKATGSTYMANAVYLRPQLKITHGDDHLKTYANTVTESGATVNRSFCSNCGSPVFCTNSKFDGMVVVTSGTMNDNAGWRPDSELFCRSRSGWIPKVEGTEQFEAMMLTSAFDDLQNEVL